MKLFGDSSTADYVTPLDNLDAQPGTRQITSACQAVVARANDDDIELVVAWRGHTGYARDAIRRSVRITGNLFKRKSDPIESRGL